MDPGRSQAQSQSNHKALLGKGQAILSSQTPGRPLRPEEQGLLLSHDLVNHAAVQKVLPFFLSDGTNLLSHSSVVLADGQGQYAVLALQFVPQGTEAGLQASKLEAAKCVAELRAQQLVRDEGLVNQPGSAVAVGVVSNVAGLEWVTPPPEPLLQQLLPAAAAVRQGVRKAAAGQGRAPSALLRALCHAGVLLAGCATAAAFFAMLMAACACILHFAGDSSRAGPHITDIAAGLLRFVYRVL